MGSWIQRVFKGASTQIPVEYWYCTSTRTCAGRCFRTGPGLLSGLPELTAYQLSGGHLQDWIADTLAKGDKDKTPDVKSWTGNTVG